MNVKPHIEIAGSIDKIDNLVSRFYIRLMVKNQPGVFAQIGKIIADLKAVCDKPACIRIVDIPEDKE
jgi:hypothetical protein